MKKNFFFSLIILILIKPLAYSQVDLENGLLMYHSFENGSLIDVSGNDRNCILNGAIQTTDANGNPNQAYEFDGMDDNMIIQSDEELEGGASPFTFSFQFQILKTQPFQPIIGKYLDANNKDWAIRVDNSKFIFTAEIGGGDPVCIQSSTSEIKDSIWYCGIVTLSEPNVMLYLDGELVASCDNFSQEIASTNAPIEIGSILYINRFFKGKLDEIRIYNRILNSQEIDSLCNVVIVSNTEIEKQDIAIKIFPNPADDAIFIETNQEINGIRIFDVLGKEQRYIKANNIRFLSNMELDTSTMPPGIYIIEVDIAGNKIRRKVIVN